MKKIQKIFSICLLLSLSSILVLPVQAKAITINHSVKNHNYISSKVLSSSASVNLTLASYRVDANDIVVIANYNWYPGLPSYRKTDAFAITYDKSKFTLSEVDYTVLYNTSKSKGEENTEVRTAALKGPGYISCFAPLKIDDSYATVIGTHGSALIYLHSNDANVSCTANIYYAHMTSGNFGIYVPTSSGLTFTGDGLYTESTSSGTVPAF